MTTKKHEAWQALKFTLFSASAGKATCPNRLNGIGFTQAEGSFPYSAGATYSGFAAIVPL